MIQIPSQLKNKEFKFIKIKQKGKSPIEKDWTTTNNYDFDDPKLIEHLSTDNNYGVVCGYANLIVIDFDDESLQNEIANKLPKTFTVKSGGGLLHKYYICDEEPKSFKILDEVNNTLADIQGKNKQIIGPGSIHPNGNTYEITDVSEISHITYKEIKEAFKDYLKPEIEITPKDVGHDNNEFLELVKQRIKFPDVLKHIGVDISKNPTKCPFHEMTGAGNLGYNNETGHCFHCDGSWNIFSIMKQFYNCNFKKALMKLIDLSNLHKEYEQYRMKYITSQVDEILEHSKNHLELKNKEYKISSEVLTDIANKQEDSATERIVEYLKQNYNLITTMDDIKNEVWFYDDGIYKPNGESRIIEIVRRILGSLFTPTRTTKVLHKIRADTMMDAESLFSQNHVEEIPVQNGVLNIKTRELSPFTPEKIFFNKLPMEYDDTKTCPNIEKFFECNLKDKDASKVMFELFGYCLYKEHFIEKAVMMIGEGRNGKGKTISLLQTFLGATNCCSVPLSQMNSSSTGICELHGKLANLAGDLSSTSLKETGMFKEITGRDMIGAKRKYLRDLFFVNYSKQIFACNKLPRVYDTSDGFWERWMIFEFPYKFVPKEVYDNMSEDEKKNKKIQDTDIIKLLTTDDELSGLLNRALDGLKLLLEKKTFSYSKSLQAIKELWIRKADSFEAFCMDFIEDGEDCAVPKKVVRKLYTKYCRKYNLRGVSDRYIRSKLEDLYGVVEDRIDLTFFNYGKTEYVWDGIKIKDCDEIYTKINTGWERLSDVKTEKKEDNGDEEIDFSV
jgi:putative DNA primase/helicase